MCQHTWEQSCKAEAEFLLRTCLREGVHVENHLGVAAVVHYVPPLDRLDVAQQRIVGNLHPSPEDF